MTLLPIKQKRIWEIDFLRGFAVILMIFDHAMWDCYLMRSWFTGTPGLNGNEFLLGLHNFALEYLLSDLRFWGHIVFSNLFIFLVGVSTVLSHNNLKRGTMLLIVAVAFTLATYGISLYIDFNTIIFGILQCLALSLLLYCFIDQFTKNKWVYLIIAIPVIALGISWEFWNTTYVSEFEFSNLGGLIIGYGAAYGEDYFALFPYFGVLLLGAFFGMSVYKSKRSALPKLDGKWNKPICFIGRHALVIYIAHQIIMPVFIVIMAMSLGCRI